MSKPLQIYFQLLVRDEAIDGVTNEKINHDIEMKLMEEDVKKNSILLYEKEMVGDIQGLISNVSGQCKCEVNHLPNIQVLVLSYKNERSAQ